MDQLRAQLGNYLEWLESRGLSGPVSFRTPADASAIPSTTEYHVPEAVPPHQRHVDIDKPSVIPAPAPEAASVAAHRVTGMPESDARSAAAVRTVASAPAVPSAAEREPGMPWKVGFYSSSDLTEEEFIMVSRIALALGLPAEDFKIWAEDSLVHVPVELLRCSYIVALGPGSGQTLLALGQTVTMNTVQKALQGSPVLTIPHPRAMLKDPNLKGGAWTALQKFKGLMTH